MVLGHAAVTAAAHRILARRWPRVAAIPLGLLLLGAHLPDLVDKSLSLAFSLASRGYGHSLLVQSVVFGGLFLSLPRWRRPLGALGLGVAAHLAQDWVDIEVLVAPLLGLLPPSRFDVFESVWGFYSGGGPLVWLEISALLYWLVVLARHRLRAGRALPRIPRSRAAATESSPI
jgi:hypothetical protein